MNLKKSSTVQAPSAVEKEQAPSAPVTARRKVREKRLNTAIGAAPSILSVRSAMLQESILVARKDYGDNNICAAGEASRIVIGLPLPSLSLEYLIQNTVWPLSRFTQVVGKTGTCKSAFCFELVRWFKESAGLAYLLENETRYSPDLALSIIGYPKSADDEVLAHLPCDSVDDWQSKLQSMTKWCQDQMLKKEIGRKFPVLFIVDSLMGKLSKESQGNIEKAGNADRAFPHEALMINSFLKKYPQDIEEWPMCLVATNHLKPKKSEHGPQMERHKAGGATPDFQETFEIEMSVAGNSRISLVDEEAFEIGGKKLILACKKNSLGETDRKIQAEVRWVHREDPETGEYRQQTKWDWPAATVHLLASFDKGHKQERIKEIVEFGGNGNKWYSKTFGIPSADPVSAHDLGVLIEGDLKIKQALRRLFGIKERKIFQPGVDYLKQLNELRQAAERTMVK